MDVTEFGKSAVHSAGEFRGTNGLDAFLAKMQGKDDFKKRNAALGQPLAQVLGESFKLFEIAIEQRRRAAANKRRHHAGEFVLRERPILT
ncbi:MAG TPA: hypothetical protein VNE82_03915 [Candidatus Binataceae bacterium]|nr:hypothetical protein [Candidatus Binataceae bacterium]